jgi:SAM-dependent methyltransferase
MDVRAVGLDATKDMLRRAIAGGLNPPVVAARAQKLPFQDSAFDLVSDITVVQHISSPEQRGVLNEMVRVLRPGGHLLLIELIRGEAPHIFPRVPQDWIQIAADAGLKLIFRQGQEFLLFDQVFVRTVLAIRRLTSSRKGNDLPAQEAAAGENDGSRSASRRTYWAMRRITCKLSEWAEPVVQKTCPAMWATHALFVFQKQGEEQ